MDDPKDEFGYEMLPGCIVDATLLDGTVQFAIFQGVLNSTPDIAIITLGNRRGLKIELSRLRWFRN